MYLCHTIETVCFIKAFLKSEHVIFDLYTNLLLLTNARNYLVDLFRYQEIEWRFSFSFKSEDVLKNVQKVDILKRFWRHSSLKNYERMNYNSKFIVRIEKWKKQFDSIWLKMFWLQKSFIRNNFVFVQNNLRCSVWNIQKNWKHL